MQHVNPNEAKAIATRCYVAAIMLCLMLIPVFLYTGPWHLALMAFGIGCTALAGLLKIRAIKVNDNDNDNEKEVHNG